MNHVMISGFADEIDSSLDKQIEVLKKLNMSYVEMRGVNGKSLIDYPVNEVKEIKKVLDDNQIKLSAVGSPIGKIGIQDDFTHHFEQFKHTVEIANVMNAPYIRLFSFYIPNGQYDGYRQKVIEQTGMFIDYTKSNSDQLVLLHENEKGIYGDNAQRCLDLMKVHFCDRYKAIFDFANFVQCKQDTLEAYELLSSYIVYFHVKDALFQTGEVVPAGMGDGNVQEILRKVMKQDYQGFLSLEPHLSDFVGFANLEHEKNEMARKLTGEEAFTVSYQALQKILQSL